MLAGGAYGAVKGAEVDYEADGVTLKGYLAFDDAKEGRRPGVLVVHEWWGHNDYARKRADMLAELGYVALAVDMYGDGKTAKHPEDAAKFSSAVKANATAARARFQAALDLLSACDQVNPDQIAAIGYCFGGGVVLQMVREGVDLRGVVSFHGSLGTDLPARPGCSSARVLVCDGEDDPFVTDEQLEAFKQEMKQAGIDYTVRRYKGAKHSFTNPDADKFGREFSLPLAYNQDADEASWADMQDFFNSLFAE
jgi:dienelactone hydrolase